MKLRWLPLLFAAIFAMPAFDAAAARSQSAGKTSASAKKHVIAKGKSKASPAGTRKGRGKRGARRPAAAPMVQGEGAATPVKPNSVTPKNIPARAYAADGQSFYLNGERIRIRGVPYVGPEGSEVAKQRLQKALDSGDVSLAEKGIDQEGNSIAIVRINGRDVADLLLLDEIRSGNLP